MSRNMSVRRVNSIMEIRAAGGQDNYPFSPREIVHVYLKLDFKHEYENATNAADALKFLRSVSRAAHAIKRIAESFGGDLLEAQGSMLHVGLPADSLDTAGIIEQATCRFASRSNRAFRQIFNERDRCVQGWRFAADAGKTLLVTGRCAHGDDSIVSLGESANAPAKYLYSQLEVPEDMRKLKRFMIAFRDPHSESWKHEELDSLSTDLFEMVELVEEARALDPTVKFMRPSQTGLITAQAAPIGRPGDPGAPTANKPDSRFGWVFRADLDGFTSRVKNCFGNDDELCDLASHFYELMQTATDFVTAHQEVLVQLPWAGDNCTFAAVFDTQTDYEAARECRVVEFVLDFEKEISEFVSEIGYGGWAYGVAGGTPHRNAKGNIYIAGIEVDDRRYLLAAGEGVGRSTQAFADVNPKSSEVALYHDDCDTLRSDYKAKFKSATTSQDRISTLFKTATVKDLQAVQLEGLVAPASVRVQAGPEEEREVTTRHWFQ